MNQDFDYTEIPQEPEQFELSSSQAIAILIAVGLFCWGAYRLFQSTGTPSSVIPPPIPSSKLSASEIASLLAT
jgi:hypothetical protein